jgi:hypothetical protein
MYHYCITSFLRTSHWDTISCRSVRLHESLKNKEGKATELDCVWNVMAHAQKPDFVFRRNVRVHLNRQGRQFSRLLAAEVCASAVVMLDIPSSEVVWRVLAMHFIRQFPLHFLLPCVTVCHHISAGLYHTLPHENHQTAWHTHTKHHHNMTSLNEMCMYSWIGSKQYKPESLSKFYPHGFRNLYLCYSPLSV